MIICFATIIYIYIYLSLLVVRRFDDDVAETRFLGFHKACTIYKYICFMIVCRKLFQRESACFIVASSQGRGRIIFDTASLV